MGQGGRPELSVGFTPPRTSYTSCSGRNDRQALFDLRPSVRSQASFEYYYYWLRLSGAKPMSSPAPASQDAGGQGRMNPNGHVGSPSRGEPGLSSYYSALLMSPDEAPRLPLSTGRAQFHTLLVMLTYLRHLSMCLWHSSKPHDEWRRHGWQDQPRPWPHQWVQRPGSARHPPPPDQRVPDTPAPQTSHKVGFTQALCRIFCLILGGF